MFHILKVCTCGKVFLEEKKEYKEIQGTASSMIRNLYKVNHSDIFLKYGKCDDCEKAGKC